MRTNCAYLLDEKPKVGQVEFWGEWEPESNVVENVSAPLSEGPHQIFRPYWRRPGTFLGLQNTDPFVFGQRICYMGCQQRTKKWETRLRHLDRGSVVLFGSQISGRFVLDTALVVDSWIEHSAASFSDLARSIDPTYYDVTFGPWYSANVDPSLSWRLYFGATFNDPVDGMYSFFPCLQAKTPSQGFARPVLTLEGFVNPALRQGKKATEVSCQQAVDLWSRVREQVLRDRLLLGLTAEMPPETHGGH